MNSENGLDDRLRIARMRSSLSELNDDTGIEEDLAALYLCVSVKKLGELRANGGGPVFVKPTDPKAAGRNQPVSYVLAELRKWRESMTASSNLEVAKRQGLLGWVSVIEPFWMDLQNRVIGPALDQNDEQWPGLFSQALEGLVRVAWMSPRDALRERWTNVESHLTLVAEFNLVLDGEKFAALAAVEATEIAIEIGGASISARRDG